MGSCGEEKSRTTGSGIQGKLNPESIRLNSSNDGCQNSYRIEYPEREEEVF